MTELYIVRHCEAAGNIEHYFQGHMDGAASERGARQCDRLAERFRDIPLAAVYSSPLSRALTTAGAVNRYHDLPIRLRDDLMEINGGHWEGEKWAELPTLFPEEAEVWAEHPWDFSPEGGETMQSVYDRIWNAVLEIARENEGKTAAAVSHGCAIRCLYTRLLSGEITGMNETPWCDNTGVTKLVFDENFCPTVIFHGDTSHLNEGMSTLAEQTWWRADSKSKFE